MTDNKEFLSEEAIHRIHQLPIDEVYQTLKSRVQGLTSAECQERIDLYGPNAIQKSKGTPMIVRFLSNFIHLMAILLWIAGIVALIAKMPELAIAVWMVNVINGLFSFWQEFRASKATEALRKMLPSYARVLRDAQENRVPVEELVPGDVVLLSEGDKISADCRLVDQAELQVDQSTLTGESRPVNKTRELIFQEGITHTEIPNIVFAGTNVVSGTGKALVFATGMNTEFGKIAHLTQSVGSDLSPLQKEMDNVTKQITFIAVGIGVLFFIVAITLAKINLVESFIFALGMIVAFVPEGLLPTVTLALAMGTQRMAHRHALIKKLSAVETLGCTNYICTDKTGTLTQNEMTVRNLWLPVWQGSQHDVVSPIVTGWELTVSGIGYDPEGQIFSNGRPVDDPRHGALGHLLLGSAMCNNAKLLPPNGDAAENGEKGKRWTILGDPTEAALKVVARKAGFNLETEERRLMRMREIPFESRRKRMSTIHRKQTGGRGQFAFVKGAPKEVLDLCTHCELDGQAVEMTATLRKKIMEANDQYARDGLRVLALAHRDLPERLPIYDAESVEQDLTFVGLAAMIDPPRPEVAEAVDKCHTAGIHIVMITGDYGLTAESIARRIGIIKGANPQIITGFDLDKMSPDQLKTTLQNEVIFARVAPEHKLRVVSTLQEMGNIVAVTGDGVNDAPALKKADIGVAMGISGSDVAKEAASMILTDDNFASIVNAVEEGRAVYANIKRFTSYIFTSNTPEAVPFIIFALSAARIPIALNVMHILSIDLGTDIVPALALGAEPPEPGVMDRPPRNLNEHVITKSLLLRSYAWLGPIQSLAAMAAFYFMYWTNGYWGRWIDLPGDGDLYRSATAMALGAVVTTQIGNLLAQRTETASFFKSPLFNNKLIWVGIASELVAVAAFVYLPPFQEFIGTNSFPLVNWVFLFAWTPSLLLIDEMRKWVLRKRLQRKQAARAGL
jgi:potassium/sodium efflux P-type ATPase